jgi:thioredoxin 1
MSMGNEVILTEDNFDGEVLQADLPVLVDFWAPWCGPCKMIAQSIEEIADEYNGKLKVAKCNVDDNFNIANKYEIKSIPTLILFKGGEVAGSSVGAVAKDTIINMFKGEV